MAGIIYMPIRETEVYFPFVSMGGIGQMVKLFRSCVGLLVQRDCVKFVKLEESWDIKGVKAVPGSHKTKWI